MFFWKERKSIRSPYYSATCTLLYTKVFGSGGRALTACAGQCDENCLLRPPDQVSEPKEVGYPASSYVAVPVCVFFGCLHFWQSERMTPDLFISRGPFPPPPPFSSPPSPFWPRSQSSPILPRCYRHAACYHSLERKENVGMASRLARRFFFTVMSATLRNTPEKLYEKR